MATYRCNPGYVLTGGNGVRTCEDPGNHGNDNRFNGEAPTCELFPPDGKKCRYNIMYFVSMPTHPPTHTHTHPHTPPHTPPHPPPHTHTHTHTLTCTHTHAAVTVGMESARVTVSEGQYVVGVVIAKDPTQRDLLITVRLDSIYHGYRSSRVALIICIIIFYVLIKYILQRVAYYIYQTSYAWRLWGPCNKVLNDFLKASIQMGICSNPIGQICNGPYFGNRPWAILLSKTGPIIGF